jgi:hypothetical protein
MTDDKRSVSPGLSLMLSTKLPSNLPSFFSLSPCPSSSSSSSSKRYDYPKGLVERLAKPDMKWKPFKNLSSSTTKRWIGDMDNPDLKGSNFDLLRAIGRNNQGITYNSYLTNPTSARYWLDRKQAEDAYKGTNKYTGWQIDSEDLDQDPSTPDDVILYDSNGNPQVVSGYSLNSGKVDDEQLSFIMNILIEDKQLKLRNL